MTLGLGSSLFQLHNGCLDDEIAKRFREGFGPGFVSGVNAAITDPANAESGLREAAAAFFTGLGGVIEPRQSGNSRR